MNTDHRVSRRLADHVRAAQRKYFVGRSPELELFRSALSTPEPPFAVLHVYGPGGIGKTTLLSEFQRMAQGHGWLTVYLDGRSIDPSPPGFRQALQMAADVEAQDILLDELAASPRNLLLLDTYERLTSLDGWLRDVFLPQLPGQTLVVIAGRDAPDPAWRTASGWRDVTRLIALRNFQPEESKTYLTVRGISEDQQQPVLAFTHGHPLALALIADAAHQGASLLKLEDDPDIVRVLLTHFLQNIPAPAHHAALEICAHVRVTTESLLAGVLDMANAHPIFEWLRGLSFIEHGPEGVFPHDLVRDVLDTDLRWRNPDYYRQMHQRVRHFLIQRFQGASGTVQQRAFFDVMYMHRNNPIMQPFYDWKTFGQGYAEMALHEDFPPILEMVERYEGAESAAIAAHWIKRQPQSFVAFRGIDGELLGFTANLELHLISPEDLEVDPALQAAFAFIQSHGPVRGGEEIVYHRYYIARDSYQQASPVFSLVAMDSAKYWLTHPKLSWCFVATADPEFWKPQFTYSNLWRSPEADFEVGGRRYGVFSHDWRVESAERWLEVTGERELNTEMTVEQITAMRPLPLIVLSETEFVEAVRHALRDYLYLDSLAGNPLMKSRIVADQAGGDASAATLQALLRAAAESLKDRPRDEKFYQAIYHTYLHPAPTQEHAAELLDVPFNTYRYRLNTGIERITNWLWQRELHGFDGK